MYDSAMDHPVKVAFFQKIWWGSKYMPNHYLTPEVLKMFWNKSPLNQKGRSWAVAKNAGKFKRRV